MFSINFTKPKKEFEMEITIWFLKVVNQYFKHSKVELLSGGVQISIKMITFAAL